MPVPIISVSQMREWEKATWATGKSENEVIQTVGRLVAERVRELTRHGDTILLLAGKGHNGDDVRAAQPYLFDRNPILLEVKDPTALEQLELWLKKHKSKATWILDGLFGIGLNRPLDEQWIRFIKAVNDADLPIIAVDSPSGLNVDTGLPEGIAIQADVTLTVGTVKAGLLKPQASQYVGRLEVLPEIGLVPCPFNTEVNWTLAEDFDIFPPCRPVESHKGTYGHLAIFAGSLGYHGAAVLSSRGALRAQPGLVSVWTQPSVYIPIAAQFQSAMVHPWNETSLPKTCTAVLFGPGLASQEITAQFKEDMRLLWRKSSHPVIVDASALDWLPAGPVPKDAIRVITPHPGEAARMLGVNPGDIQSNRVGALKKLSSKFGDCIVVLKGHQTLIGRATGNIFINSSGNPFLAQGGTGDVLSGFISGLLAQPALRLNPLKTISFAVWEHGATADRLNIAQPNWSSEDLALHLNSHRSKIQGP